jgi:hypothetical protein
MPNRLPASGGPRCCVKLSGPAFHWWLIATRHLGRRATWLTPIRGRRIGTHWARRWLAASNGAEDDHPPMGMVSRERQQTFKSKIKEIFRL